MTLLSPSALGLACSPPLYSPKAASRLGSVYISLSPPRAMSQAHQKILEEKSYSSEPAVEYQSRLEHRGLEAARWLRLEKTISVSRLLVMIVLAVVAWLSLQSGLFSPAWALVPLGLFIALVFAHRRVLSRASLAQRSAQYYEHGLARIEDRWVGNGPSGERFVDGAHPYAVDLDIFGNASLFQLLCTARTRSGEEVLAQWLLESGTEPEIRQRQDAVIDLRQRVDFREELWRLGENVAERLHPDALIPWAEAGRGAPSKVLRTLLAGLAGLQIFAIVAWASLGQGPTLLLALLLVHSVVVLVLRSSIRSAFDGLEGAGRELDMLGQLISRIQLESFEAPSLQALRKELDASGPTPSHEIARLQRLVDFFDSRKNPLFAPISVALVWTPQLAFAVDSWRATAGKRIRRWIEIAGEIEATAALSGYAYEHPEDAFPDIVSSDDEPTLEGETLGHPLCPRDTFRRNDIELNRERRALIISGSNMSGKSTYLRTVGVNTVLALAGAPVRASRLRLSCFRIGASLEIHDSLQDGQSRFYAEILRLRQVLTLAKEGGPVLFLLDEILHGTNSHDRRIGADAVVRSLLRHRTLGLVTTHDLALSQIAEDPEVAALNVHFEDSIEDGKMVFDYQLRPGVVTKSNALALMREVGLEV